MLKKGQKTHRADPNLRGDIRLLVRVDLAECDGVAYPRGIRKALEDGRDDAAGPAPRRPEVDDDGGFGVDLSVVEKLVANA